MLHANRRGRVNFERVSGQKHRGKSIRENEGLHDHFDNKPAAVAPFG